VYTQDADPGREFAVHAAARYRLEPYIASFADFASGRGKDVLEVGVGMGADHLEWAKAGPRSLTGIDLTPRAVTWTASRLSDAGLTSDLRVADAEELPFPDGSYDLVYSWGVLHHSPDTASAVAEVHRVLRPGGTAKIMIYHTRSIVGGLLWVRYGLLAGQPRRPLRDIYAHHLESPGTQAFTVREAQTLFKDFAEVRVRSQLGFGDLLQGEVGQRHPSALLVAAKRIWPRAAIRRLLPGFGLGLLIEATK